MFVTSLLDNDLKYNILRYLRKNNIDTSKIFISNGRLGLYWTENGVSVRSSKVIYDRKNSSFFNSKYKDYNWENIFKDGKWFHTSRINVALSKEKSKMLIEVLKKAKQKKLISFLDLNYRNILWAG